MSTLELQQVLTILFRGHQRYRTSPRTSTTYFTMEQIDALSTEFGLPIPADLQTVLTRGVRQGAFLRCGFRSDYGCPCVQGLPPIIPNSERPILLYAFNPNMLAANALNRTLLIRNNCINCLDMYNQAGAYTVASVPLALINTKQGEQYGIGSGCCAASCFANPPVQSTACCGN